MSFLGDSLNQQYYFNLALIIMSVGFLFKVSAAPFHFWSPDVYDGIPTIVTTFVAIIAKISIFILLSEIVYFTSNFFTEFNWTSGLLISSLLSLIIGTVVGLTQFRIKRLFAYSTISHVGFILLALSINSIESIQAFVFYLMQYSISNLNAFIILVTIGFSFYFYVTNNKEHKELLDVNNSPLQLISQLKGYFYVNPVLALSLAITIFSFVGVPPLVGFFAKQMVLSAALDSGYVFLSLIAILTSVIGAVYYLNIIKEIFFYKPEYKINSLLKDKKFQGYIYNKNVLVQNIEFKHNNIVMSSPISITIASITLIILLFIFMNKEWLSMGKKIQILKTKCNISLYYVYFTFLNWVSSIFHTTWMQNSKSMLRELNPKLAIFDLGSSSTSSYLNPWFVTGFTDAEGSFMIHFEKSKNFWRIRPTFQIKLSIEDLSLLQKIKQFFLEVGHITVTNTECVYKVRSISELSVIINHFNKYSLCTQKWGDFKLFSNVLNLLIEERPLSKEGFSQILSYCSVLNTGLPVRVKEECSYDLGSRPILKFETIPSGHWMAGFVTGEGSFSVVDSGKNISLSFRISQHIRDENLLRHMVNYFNCGIFNYHNKEKSAGTFVVRRFDDNWNRIIPFFLEYSVLGVKKGNFQSWVLVASLIKEKKHLDVEGLKKIREITQKMNSFKNKI